MGQHSSGKNYINEEPGLLSWFTSLDHKRIAILYFFSVMSFFLVGGIMALLLRLELFAPNTTANVGQVLKNGDIYNQVLTYHGAIMVFMVIIPGIPAFPFCPSLPAGPAGPGAPAGPAGPGAP
jgi:cytochrome c oxidase subunit 1